MTKFQYVLLIVASIVLGATAANYEFKLSQIRAELKQARKTAENLSVLALNQHQNMVRIGRRLGGK